MADATYIVQPGGTAGLSSGGLQVVTSIGDVPSGSYYYFLSPDNGVFYQSNPTAAPATTTDSTASTAPTVANVTQPGSGVSPSRSGGGGTGELNVFVSAADVAADRPIQCPSRMMLPDEQVEVTALPGNVGNVQVSTIGPSGAKFGPALTVTPGGVPRSLNLRVLSEVWIYSVGGHALDGVSFTIRNAPRR